MQTRRNDKTADVENRAIWTVQGITAEGLELVSVADSGERRTVSHDYASGHVHLAYASTVHGIQDEATDAAIVGPGVNAAGLYVGMTRGRVHNEAIAIARTDAAARDAIADSMLRGVVEVSVEDSVRAARSELGRAARSLAPAAWHDRDRRPFGDVVDIDRMVAMTLHREGEARERLARMSAWTDAAERALLGIDAEVAGRAAVDHGRASRVDEADASLSEGLRDRFDARLDELADLNQELAVLACRAEEIDSERGVRASLGTEKHDVEDRARQGAAAQTSATSDRSVAGLER